MGPRNKGAIIRRTDLEKTPISEIFRGQLRSRVHRYGDQVTDNVQPFFTLPLYIEVICLLLILIRRSFFWGGGTLAKYHMEQHFRH